ncbi:MAG: hypothetical protein ACOX7D_01900 [Alphaproteobacteria bacterium]|jgi:hypothetical protein|nr:hypothetical protein [Alphaproteobacteria bacterium]
MKVVKANLKLIVGILALVLAAAIFFIAMKSQSNLEEGNLRAWLSASDSRRAAAIEILTGTTENLDLMVLCVSKMASMPDSGKLKVRDAASLCSVGIALRKNNE